MIKDIFIYIFMITILLILNNIIKQLKYNNEILMKIIDNYNYEPIIEPLKELLKEPIKEAINEPIIEAIIEAINEPIIEPIIEPIKEPKNKYMDFRKKRLLEMKDMKESFSDKIKIIKKEWKNINYE